MLLTVNWEPSDAELEAIDRLTPYDADDDESLAEFAYELLEKESAKLLAWSEDIDS